VQHKKKKKMIKGKNERTRCGGRRETGGYPGERKRGQGPLITVKEKTSTNQHHHTERGQKKGKGKLGTEGENKGRSKRKLV